MRRRPAASVLRRLPSRPSTAANVLRAAVLAALAVPIAAQAQFALLGKQGLPADADATKATVLGDVDGDGDLDLIVGNEDQNRLWRNDGHGTFSDATAGHVPVGITHTRALALGDVDGDGDLDLVVGVGGVNATNASNQLWLNDGTGRFTDATATHLPLLIQRTTSLAFGDVDGDGDLDLLVGTDFNSPNRLLRNDGTGRFTDATAARLPAVNHATTSLALGDVDGDGDLDLVVGNGNVSYQGGPTNRLWLNDGTGTFTDATSLRMPTAIRQTTSLALGDVDRDGDLDLVVGHGNERTRLYANDGAGTFTDVTTTQMPASGHSTQGIVLGDLDGDGDLDLVSCSSWWQYPEKCRLFLNDGGGTFTDATQSHLPEDWLLATSLALGDVDGDGTLDLAVGCNYGQSGRLYLNDGTGTFTDATAPRIPPGPASGRHYTLAIATGDLDGDGDLDLVFGNLPASNYSPGNNALYLNDGSGAFEDATDTRLPFGTSFALAIGDVDGDGDLDLVSSDYLAVGPSNRLFLNDGTGTFTDATAAHMPSGLGSGTSLALGDVDGDGDLDLLVGIGGQQSRLLRNDGTGTFTDVTAAQVPVGSYSTSSLALGDVDGDGDLDLLLGNRRQQDRLWRNDGTGTFTDATATTLPVGVHETTSLALGDVDGDGDLDLVVGCGAYGANQQTLVYENDGTGTFTDVTAAQMPVGSYQTGSVALGDLDGDGDLDLLLGNVFARSRLYRNDGTGTFTDETAAHMPVGDLETFAVATFDSDRDGDLDIVLGDLGAGAQGRLCFNLQRQLDAPHVLRVGRDYRLDVYSRHGAPSLVDFALPYFSTAAASIQLPPYGVLGIDPNQAVALPPFLVPQPAGVGSLSIPVPNLPALAGLPIHTQAVLVRYPALGELTNVQIDTVRH